MRTSTPAACSAAIVSRASGTRRATYVLPSASTAARVGRTSCNRRPYTSSSGNSPAHRVVRQPRDVLATVHRELIDALNCGERGIAIEQYGAKLGHADRRAYRWIGRPSTPSAASFTASDKRRMRVNRHADVLRRPAVLEREHHFCAQLRDVRPDHVRPEQLVGLRIGDELHEAAGLRPSFARGRLPRTETCRLCIRGRSP